MKSLVVFYSRRGENWAVGNIKVGNAEAIAKTIQRLTDSDIFEIEPVVDYTKDYNEMTEVAMKELRSQARPKFKNPLESIEGYDVIYICYPNWWGTYPRVVASFLDAYDFSGKTIKPMCTHEGSGMGSSVSELQNTLKNSIIKPGLAIRGINAHNSNSKIEKWINE